MKIGIIGAGPAGVMAGINLLDCADEIIFFDKNLPLATLLPTGGGRCNLGYAEFDNYELVKFYPRGEKFLLSVFSRFSTGDTIDFFEKIGVPTYIQDDLRIFPASNSSKDVRQKLLQKLQNPKVKFYRENVLSFNKHGDDFFIKTEKSEYSVDKTIFAGGIKNNYQLLKNCGISLVEPRPALCALCVEESNLYSLSGVSFKNISAFLCDKKQVLSGDLLITHNSLSGPLAFKISSVCAYEKFPYEVELQFVSYTFEKFDEKLRMILEKDSKKDFANILSKFVPKSFVKFLLQKTGVDIGIKSSQVNKLLRTMVAKSLTGYRIRVISQKLDGEIVTAGGVNLNAINPTTMEYRDVPGLYFCGEVLDIDGFTGGFNLQNCWSTGFVAALGIANNIKS